MLTDHDVKYLLRQWAAALDADERTRVANELNIQLPDGIPVDAHCMDGAGNQIGLIGAWVERRACQPEGGLQFTVSLPEEAEGAEVNRLILHGPREDEDGSMGYAAIPMGKVEGGKVEVRLSEKAVNNCPITLNQATVAGVELVPQPWFARLLASGAEVVHVGRSVCGAITAWIDEVRLSTVRPPAVALADTGSAVPQEQEHVFEDDEMTVRMLATDKGEVLITFEAKSDDLEGQVVTFPVKATSLIGEDINEAHLVLTRREPAARPSATIRLHTLDEMAFEQDRVLAVTDEPLWGPEHLPALQWSLARVQTTAGKEKLRSIIAEAEQPEE